MLTQNKAIEQATGRERPVVARKVRQLPATMPEFWELASAAQSSTKHLLDANVQGLAHASLDRLRSVLIQYRWFTSYYTGDLAILVYKLPPSSLRSALAEFLVEELGMGDSAQTHPVMYDRFLTGLGVDPEALEKGANPSNLALLEAFRHKLLMGDFMYGVGLRGMGAECLCQVYLEAVHHYLLKNEEIIKRRSELDWSFWDIHASEADQMHGEKTREYIERIAACGSIQSLAAGYIEAEQMFMQFWANAYAGPANSVAPASGRDPFVPTDGWCYDAAR
jgi:hypothetical protein